MLVLLVAALAWGEENERDWMAQYERGIDSSRAAMIAAGVGLGVASTGGALGAAVGTCDPVDGVCTNNWLGDGLVVTGGIVGNFGAGALAANGLRARRSLKNLGVEVTPAPAIGAWLLTAGSVATIPLWVGFAKPATWSPDMPYVDDPAVLALNGVFLAGAYGFGIWQYALVNGKAPPVEPPAVAPSTTGRLQLDLVPFATGDHRGFALVGRW